MAFPRSWELAYKNLTLIGCGLVVGTVFEVVCQFGTYTRMLQKTQNVSWCHHMTNQEQYGSLPRITTIVRQRRLRLAGHVMRHDGVANNVLLWKPGGPRRRGRPTTTLENITEKDMNLSGINLLTAMKDQNHWK